MDDLISRQAAIDIADDPRDCISVDGYWAWTERLKKLPAADVVPVVHGEWIDNNNIWMCNKCGKWIDILQGDADMNFCQNCGADMKGKVKRIIPKSIDGKCRVLSLSYGKDSMACLGALEELQWPLDRIVTADVWATDTIPADLPPMVEFKSYADKVILERYGIEVEHYFAKDERMKRTYQNVFYKVRTKSRANNNGKIYGFPPNRTPWCNSELKMQAIKESKKDSRNRIDYVGIAIDEPSRFHNLSSKVCSPLVEIGWTEADCRAWCEENDLLSPIYTKSARGGCWFCHNQGVQQLRLLRKQYPDLWQLLLKWDSDSPVAFHADGHTVHDFDRRFALEDKGLIPTDRKFRWKMLDDLGDE